MPKRPVETIQVRTEQRADGWVVIVDDKHGRMERKGIATETDANEIALKLVEYIHKIFDVKDQA